MTKHALRDVRKIETQKKKILFTSVSENSLGSSKAKCRRRKEDSKNNDDIARNNLVQRFVLFTESATFPSRKSRGKRRETFLEMREGRTRAEGG